MKKLIEYWKKNREILIWRVKDYFWWLKIYYRRLVWTYVAFNLLLSPIVFGIVYLEYKVNPPPVPEKKQVCINPRALEGCEFTAMNVNNMLMRCEYAFERSQERLKSCEDKATYNEGEK